jgi:type I restriction-modification system DNA methylase subunit
MSQQSATSVAENPANTRLFATGWGVVTFDEIMQVVVPIARSAFLRYQKGITLEELEDMLQRGLTVLWRRLLADPQLLAQGTTYTASAIVIANRGERYEERGIQGNFPADKQTSETALLFLQLIMRKLKRQPKPGRAAVVVPNGTLFADGVAARIKADLLTDFNLHTIVRLPNGVFAPYTSIPTNLLFFDRSHKTETIWYYELALPEGKKNYTKTQPMQYEEFAECIAWWHHRTPNERAWQVAAADVLKRAPDGSVQSVNLDISNPNRATDLLHRSPEELVESILSKERRIAEIMDEIRQMIGKKP